MPPRGFEPLIFSLKGWCPRPLDDGGNLKHFKDKWLNMQAQMAKIVCNAYSLF